MSTPILMHNAMQNSTQKKTKMLLVDDEPHILEALTQLFDRDYHVLTASDGQMALTLFQHHPDIVIVISDQRMPGMKGVDLLKNVKQISPTSMRILLTGYADLEAVLDSVNVGEVFRYVRKPWVPETLKSIVALAMASYMLRNQKAFKQAVDAKADAATDFNTDERHSNRLLGRTEPTALDALLLDAKLASPNPSLSLPAELAPPVLPAPPIPPVLPVSPAPPVPPVPEYDIALESQENADGVEEDGFASVREELFAELRQVESFEEEFFAKLNHVTEAEREVKATSGKMGASRSAAPDKEIEAMKQPAPFEKAFYGRSGKPKILIVDDEAHILSSLSEELRAGYDVLTCTSADAALDVLETNAFIGCIMTDRRMPQKSGSEFLAEAQRLAPLVPKIMMTAFADAEETIQLINTGVLFRHIEKPWNPNKLSHILSEAVSECRQRVEAGIERRQPSQPVNAIETLLSKPVTPCDFSIPVSKVKPVSEVKPVAHTASAITAMNAATAMNATAAMNAATAMNTMNTMNAMSAIDKLKQLNRFLHRSA